MKELKLLYIIMQHIPSNLSGYFHSIARTAPDRKKVVLGSQTIGVFLTDSAHRFWYIGSIVPETLY